VIWVEERDLGVLGINDDITEVVALQELEENLGASSLRNMRNSKHALPQTHATLLSGGGSWEADLGAPSSPSSSEKHLWGRKVTKRRWRRWMVGETGLVTPREESLTSPTPLPPLVPYLPYSLRS
jgi:hypothetical protein